MRLVPNRIDDHEGKFSMAKAESLDLVVEFDLVTEELLDLIEAGLPKGRTEPDEQCPQGWDSKQIVAHIAELCEFWHSDIESCLGRPKSKILGRSSLSQERLQRIDVLASLPTSELIDKATVEIGKCTALLASLEPKDLDMQVTHLTDGQIPVSELASRHLIAHLSEHLGQLRALEEMIPENT